MPPTISITADDREARSGVIAALQTMDGVELTVQRLEVGDYRVGDGLVFERKTLPDFALSIKDRGQGQMNML